MIKKVQFENLRFSDRSQTHAAVVILTTDNATFCMTGRAALAQTAPGADIRSALLEDALRQVRRMPEFRTGENQIAVEHDIASQMRRSA